MFIVYPLALYVLSYQQKVLVSGYQSVAEGFRFCSSPWAPLEVSDTAIRKKMSACNSYCDSTCGQWYGLQSPTNSKYIMCFTHKMPATTSLETSKCRCGMYVPKIKKPTESYFEECNPQITISDELLKENNCHSICSNHTQLSVHLPRSHVFPLICAHAQVLHPEMLNINLNGFCRSATNKHTSVKENMCQCGLNKRNVDYSVQLNYQSLANNRKLFLSASASSSNQSVNDNYQFLARNSSNLHKFTDTIAPRENANPVDTNLGLVKSSHYSARSNYQSQSHRKSNNLPDLSYLQKQKLSSSQSNTRNKPTAMFILNKNKHNLGDVNVSLAGSSNNSTRDSNNNNNYESQNDLNSNKIPTNALVPQKQSKNQSNIIRNKRILNSVDASMLERLKYFSNKNNQYERQNNQNIPTSSNQFFPREWSNNNHNNANSCAQNNTPNITAKGIADKVGKSRHSQDSSNTIIPVPAFDPDNNINTLTQLKNATSIIPKGIPDKARKLSHSRDYRNPISPSTSISFNDNELVSMIPRSKERKKCGEPKADHLATQEQIILMPESTLKTFDISDNVRVTPNFNSSPNDVQNQNLFDDSEKSCEREKPISPSRIFNPIEMKHLDAILGVKLHNLIDISANDNSTRIADNQRKKISRGAGAENKNDETKWISSSSSFSNSDSYADTSQYSLSESYANRKSVSSASSFSNEHKSEHSQSPNENSISERVCSFSEMDSKVCADDEAGSALETPQSFDKFPSTTPTLGSMLEQLKHSAPDAILLSNSDDYSPVRGEEGHPNEQSNEKGQRLSSDESRKNFVKCHGWKPLHIPAKSGEGPEILKSHCEKLCAKSRGYYRDVDSQVKCFTHKTRADGFLDKLADRNISQCKCVAKFNESNLTVMESCTPSIILFNSLPSYSSDLIPKCRKLCKERVNVSIIYTKEQHSVSYCALVSEKQPDEITLPLIGLYSKKNSRCICGINLAHWFEQ